MLYCSPCQAYWHMGAFQALKVSPVAPPALSFPHPPSSSLSPFFCCSLLPYLLLSFPPLPQPLSCLPLHSLPPLFPVHSCPSLPASFFPILRLFPTFLLFPLSSIPITLVVAVEFSIWEAQLIRGGGTPNLSFKLLSVYLFILLRTRELSNFSAPNKQEQQG